ncbi:MAG: hypothetical protein NW237_05055 [Cyanobacteriota bacterium]|nr:hypothetical protein [Cyanobacteriota bacterium]
MSVDEQFSTAPQARGYKFWVADKGKGIPENGQLTHSPPKGRDPLVWLV